MNVELSTDLVAVAVDDGECLRRCAAGDREALHELTSRHGVRVHRLLRAVLGDDDAAERAGVETFMRVWRDARLRESGDSVTAFITRHAIAVAARSLPADPLALGRYPDDLTPGLATMSVDERIPVALYYLKGLDTAEISRLTHRPQWWTRWKLLRARHNLFEVNGYVRGAPAGSV